MFHLFKAGGYAVCLRSRHNSWRRCSEGTNNISAFGVWRTGTRQSAQVFSRPGLTRWHQRPAHDLPSAGKAVLTFYNPREGA